MDVKNGNITGEWGFTPKPAPTTTSRPGLGEDPGPACHDTYCHEVIDEMKVMKD